jgi:hypothetical protein
MMAELRLLATVNNDEKNDGRRLTVMLVMMQFPDSSQLMTAADTATLYAVTD